MTRVTQLAALCLCVSAAAWASGEDVSKSDQAAVRAVLQRYLDCAKWPDPSPIKPNDFAADVLARWSGGQTLRGRDAFVEAIKASRTEAEENFETVGFSTSNMILKVNDNMGWLTCELHTQGVLKEEAQRMSRNVRVTLVFERHQGKWQIVHEHSSLLSQEVGKTEEKHEEGTGKPHP